MSDFNKFIGFLVLGLVCIVGIVGLDASNIPDNKHSEKSIHLFHYVKRLSNECWYV